MLTEAAVQCYSIGFTVLGSLSLLFNTVTIIVICYESPASMHDYKYCLLNLTICDLLLSIYADILFRPITLLTVRGALISGPLKFLPHDFAPYLYGIFMGLIAIMGYAIIVCFVYRFASLTNTRLAHYIHNHCGVKVASIGGIGFFFLVGGSCWQILDRSAYAMLLQRVLPVEPLLLMIDANPMITTYPAVMTAIEAIPASCIIGAVFVVLIISLVCAISTIRGLRAGRRRMSDTTYRLQKQLTIVLCMQCLYPTLLAAVPMITTMTYLLFDWSPFHMDGDYFFCILNRLMLSVPCFDAVVTLVVVAQYRKAIVKRCKQVLIRLHAWCRIGNCDGDQKILELWKTPDRRVSLSHHM